MTSVLLNAPLILISSLGILFNGYIVTAVLLTRQVTTANNILLLHLGAIDVLLGLLFLVFSAPGYSKPGWLAEGLPCVLHGFLYNLLHPLVLWTICGLNCDRYYAIAAPLHYSHIVNAKKVLVGLGTGWFISLLLCLPPFFTVAPYAYIKGLEACAPDFSSGYGTLWYSTLYTAFTLLLPATLIICCNLKILMIARYHRHRIASAIYEVTLSAQVTITHQRNPFFVPTVTAPASGGPKFRGRSAVYSVLELVGSLALLYLPYYILITWEAVTATRKIHPSLFTAAMALLIMSPPINAFLYGLKSKPLRKTFKNYWRKKQTKNEVNNEIQARTPSTCGSRRPSLTPLGFLTKPTLQRRLSEAFLDVHTSRSTGSLKKSRFKRITTELNWRPISANNLTLDDSTSCGSGTSRKIKQTASCNTLQVPIESPDISTITEDDNLNQTKLVTNNNNNKSTLSLFQKFFFSPQSPSASKNHQEVVQNILDGTPRKSPRITITRTLSEDSRERGSNSNSLGRKLRQLKLEGENNPTTKPLLDDSSINGSDSSVESGKIFMSLDNKDGEANESSTLLLTWPRKSSDRPILLKQKSLQSQH